MRFQVAEGGVTVADCENSFDAVAQAASQEDCEDERFRRDLENSFGQDEGLERKWRREHGRDESAEEAIVIHPFFYFLCFAARMFVKKSFAGFFRDEIEDQATGERAECSHRGVVGHAHVIGDAELDEDRVREKWEREQRGIKEGDDEEAASAEGHYETLQPH